ncbi:MAG TPA: TetR family transcriptional regulator C-terminal domain-containing protein, partial [Steroidobacteraceae bacterium]
MRTRKKKSATAARIPRARNAHSRQRQRLIDACISALHIYGPSRTTVEKVVAIAKMSPGIVRFYFASKAAMLVASLQFLAAEFEEQLLVPVARLKSTPVAALKLMVDLYLDPEIASPRKVSVWYAFWGEASSRQEYYDICGQKDESFAALVRELIGQLIVDTSQPQLDPDGIALGLIGALEILWQDFAFRTESDIDRPAAKGRCMAYLRSIFPSEFASTPGTASHGAASVRLSARSAAGDRRFAGWVYDNARLFAIERELVFRNSWQFAGHRTQIAGTGDFIGVDLGIERILLVRDAMGEVRAFRNSCSEAPHILVAPPRGSLGVIDCAVHGLSFGLDGKRRGPHGTADLTALSLRLAGDLMLVRSGPPGHSAASIQSTASAADPWADFSPPPGTRPLGSPRDALIAADWKLIVEQWLEQDATASANAAGSASAANEGARVPKTLSWSARFYAGLLGSAAESGMGFAWPRRFLAPNHLIEVRQDGLTILQVLPVAPGRSLLRRHHLTLCAADRPAHAAQYVASRLNPHARWSGVAVVESIQKGIVTFGHAAAAAAVTSPAAAAFRRSLIA